MLECKNLCCVRNSKILFKNLSFQAEPQSKILIIGPNGSGKTSLMRSLCGLLLPTYGSIKYKDADIYENFNFYAHAMVYVGHKNAYHDKLTVIQNLEYWAKMRNTKESIAAAIYCLQLQFVLNIKYNELSAGWKRRVALARLLVSNANIWLIDEPFSNLDNTARDLILNLISIRSKQNGIVIMTNHNVTEQLSDCMTINISDFQIK